MKILQLCHKPPFPLLDGGCIAMYNIAMGLIKEGHQVHVLAISTPKHPVVEDIEFEEYKTISHFDSVFVDTSVSVSGFLKSVLTNESYHIKRFDSKLFHNSLIEVLKNETFDIVQMETIFMTPYMETIRTYSNAKIIVRLHNIEHKIWERLVSNEKNILKKGVLKWLAFSLKKYELSVLQKIDGFMAISSVDYNFFINNTQVNGKVIPFGIEIDHYEPDEDYLPSKTPELFHIGSMNWLPNKEGIEWFLDQVWPKIIDAFPTITFTIAGRSIPEKFYQLKTDAFHIAGEVEDAKQFMLSKDIMIVPLLSGSGIRIKIIEGMALGKTIITTSIGAEGLDISDGVNILLANTPEEFLEKVTLCVNSPEICKIIGENARNYVALHHYNNSISNEIITFYQSLLTK
ncbi:MAG: glycosyltransferase family 4 protein [Bacteroidales bacterium]|jgi:glycosyltransferase involved in cell wall biosynthesis|nr:glycosyltransferase family 4 protein [Bacteroidales bacterium]